MKRPIVTICCAMLLLGGLAGTGHAFSLWGGGHHSNHEKSSSVPESATKLDFSWFQDRSGTDMSNPLGGYNKESSDGLSTAREFTIGNISYSKTSAGSGPMSVPEPGTLLMLGPVMLGLFYLARKRLNS